MCSGEEGREQESENWREQEGRARGVNFQAQSHEISKRPLEVLFSNLTRIGPEGPHALPMPLKLPPSRAPQCTLPKQSRWIMV